jgi:hypothetical protein
VLLCAVLSRSIISEVGLLCPMPQLRVLRLNKNRIAGAPAGDSISGLSASASASELLAQQQLQQQQALAAFGQPGALLQQQQPAVVAKGWFAKSFPRLEVLELGNNRIASIAALHLDGLNELRVRNCFDVD